MPPVPLQPYPWLVDGRRPPARRAKGFFFRPFIRALTPSTELPNPMMCAMQGALMHSWTRPSHFMASHVGGGPAGARGKRGIEAGLGPPRGRLHDNLSRCCDMREQHDHIRLDVHGGIVGRTAENRFPRPILMLFRDHHLFDRKTKICRTLMIGTCHVAASPYQLTISSLSAHYQLSISLLSAHYQLAISSLSARYQLTISSLSAHYQLTINSLSAHYQLTINSLSTHYQLTINSLSAHYQLTTNFFLVLH